VRVETVIGARTERDSTCARWPGDLTEGTGRQRSTLDVDAKAGIGGAPHALPAGKEGPAGTDDDHLIGARAACDKCKTRLRHSAANPRPCGCPREDHSCARLDLRDAVRTKSVRQHTTDAAP